MTLSVNCCCRQLVFVSEMDDNVERIKKDLHMFLYHLRLPAEVFVVPLVRTILTYLLPVAILTGMSDDKIRLCLCYSSI